MRLATTDEAHALLASELKAQIFVALLAKQFGVQPAGWQEATGIFGVPGTFRSAADVVDTESLRRVRLHPGAAVAGGSTGGPGQLNRRAIASARATRSRS